MRAPAGAVLILILVEDALWDSVILAEEILNFLS